MLIFLLLHNFVGSWSSFSYLMFVTFLCICFPICLRLNPRYSEPGYIVIISTISRENETLSESLPVCSKLLLSHGSPLGTLPLPRDHPGSSWLITAVFYLLLIVSTHAWGIPRGRSMCCTFQRRCMSENISMHSKT